MAVNQTLEHTCGVVCSFYIGLKTLAWKISVLATLPIQKPSKTRGHGDMEACGDMETWRYGNMGVWGHGGMWTWKHGDMGAWRHAETWRHGGMEVWRYGVWVCCAVVLGSTHVCCPIRSPIVWCTFMPKACSIVYVCDLWAY